MIQRKQSLYLLVGTVLMTIFCFLPIGYTGADAEIAAVRPSDYPVFLILNIVIAAVLFLAIFLYKNLRRQRTVTLVSMLLIAASAVTGGIIMYGGDSEASRLEWCGGITLLIFTLLMALLAYRGIRHDQNLLSSYNRLR